MICSKCKKEIAADSKFCEFCGNKIKKKAVDSQNLPNYWKIILIITAFIFIVFIIIFYWYAIRPSQIKKGCSWIIEKGYSAEEKNTAREYINKNNCPIVDELISGRVIKKYLKDNRETTGCFINRKIIDAPDKDYRRKSSETEYDDCLRENGL